MRARHAREPFVVWRAWRNCKAQPDRLQSRESKDPNHRRHSGEGNTAMSKIVAVAAIFAAVAAVIIAAWPKLEPEAAASTVTLSTISPFDLMVKHGENLPVEDRRDMF